MSVEFGIGIGIGIGVSLPFDSTNDYLVATIE